MLSKQILYNMENGSAIRKMFIEGQELAERVGRENICDFSLGNPVAPVPQAFTDALIDLAGSEDSLTLHGYMNNAGYPEVRRAVAGNLNKRYGLRLNAENIIMTAGAAGGLNVILKAILDIDDEVIVLRPYFGEYRSYVSNWYGKVVEVDPQLPSFNPDFGDLERKVNRRTKAMIINNPVNPTGVVYSEEVIRSVAAILDRKQKEYGHAIYLISDEPYRELVYDDAKICFIPRYYANAFVAYSFSKSLSVPGERIGYLVVPDEMENADSTIDALTVANRVCGFINAPSLMQKAVARCLDEKCDVEFYNRNRRLIYNELTKLNFQCIKPQGAFYLFLKSPEADEEAFVKRAKAYNIIMVAGSTFGYPGYVRIAYCVQPEVIQRSLTGFAKLADEYGLLPKSAQN